MVPRWLRFAGLTLMLGFGVVPAAHADTRWSIDIGLGGPRVVAAPARYGYVWEPGRYGWIGHDYRWIQGRWVMPPRHGLRSVARDGNDRYRADRRWDARSGWDRDRYRGRDWRVRERDRDRRDPRQ
ncbi:MAG: hypothetical protein ACRD2I_02035 [Vicinamibacterales bacterium]